MTSVWLVTSGDYSDYHIVAAFATKELADAYAEHSPGSYGDGNAEVEEFELRSVLPELCEWLVLESKVTADGAVLHAQEVVKREWATEKLPTACMASVHPDPAAHWKEPPDVPVVRVSTDGVDHERVRKVHGEALAIARAQVEVLLSPANPDEPYPVEVNYRLGYELTEALRADVPWRVVLERVGWGALASRLESAGVDRAEAQRLATSQQGTDDMVAAAEAAAEIDRLIG